MKNTIFYCIHIDGKNVKVYRINTVENNNLEQELIKRYDSDRIEVIKPNNIYSIEGEYSKNINEYMVFTEGDDFNSLKNILNSDINESNALDKDDRFKRIEHNLYLKKMTSNGDFNFKKISDGKYYIIMS